MCVCVCALRSLIRVEYDKQFVCRVFGDFPAKETLLWPIVQENIASCMYLHLQNANDIRIRMPTCMNFYELISNNLDGCANCTHISKHLNEHEHSSVARCGKKYIFGQMTVSLCEWPNGQRMFDK